MHWNISQLYTHMDYMPLYKSSFVLGLLWQVGGVILLGCIYYCGSFLFWDCCIWLKNPFMPLFFFVLFCVFCCCGACFGLIFWKGYLEISMWDPEGIQHLFCSLIFCFPPVGRLLISQRCTLSFMAHLQAEEPGEPGTDQDVDQGRSRMCSCRSIQWERVWFGRMTFTEALLSGGEALSEESELQCSRGSGHWDNVGWELCLREFWGPFSSIPCSSFKCWFYGLMSYLYHL